MKELKTTSSPNLDKPEQKQDMSFLRKQEFIRDAKAGRVHRENQSR